MTPRTAVLSMALLPLLSTPAAAQQCGWTTNPGAVCDRHWKSPVAAVGELPASGNLIGDVRAVTDDGTAYIWLGSWVLMTGDDQIAAEVPITDAGAYFAGADVEAALQQIGPTMTDARTPTGAASNALAGTYPGPTIAPDAIGLPELAACGGIGTHVVYGLGGDPACEDVIDAAVELPILDTGGYFAASNVEAALQEIGPAITGDPIAHDAGGNGTSEVTIHDGPADSLVIEATTGDIGMGTASPGSTTPMSFAPGRVLDIRSDATNEDAAVCLFRSDSVGGCVWADAGSTDLIIENTWCSTVADIHFRTVSNCGFPHTVLTLEGAGDAVFPSGAVTVDAGVVDFWETDSPPPCSAGRIGATYFDLSEGHLCSCDGTNYVDGVGTPCT